MSIENSNCSFFGELNGNWEPFRSRQNSRSHHDNQSDECLKIWHDATLLAQNFEQLLRSLRIYFDETVTSPLRNILAALRDNLL
jgi:hypothetical protein